MTSCFYLIFSCLFIFGMGSCRQGKEQTGQNNFNGEGLHDVDTYNMVLVNDKEINLEGFEPSYPLVEDKGFYKGVFVKDRKMKISSYRIGKFEVTYKLWKEVYDWATTKAGYKFANKGRAGTEESTDEMEPVTSISWRDMIVWCNAYTEMINGNNAECVYRKSSTDETILKDSSDSSSVDKAYFSLNKKGFRLPTEIEWELAARLSFASSNMTENYGSEKEPIHLLKLCCISGANKVAGYPAFKEQEPPVTKTATVGSKACNALSIYDMGGNVWEVCWDFYAETLDANTPSTGVASGNNRAVRGGSFIGAASGCVVGWRGHVMPSMDYEHQGFRLAKTE